MHSLHKALLAAAAVCVMTSLPALAAPGGIKAPPPWAGGPGGNNKGSPGPVAGAGLPFLLLAGGYVLVRRYRNRHRAE
jgi:hypothetical protein